MTPPLKLFFDECCSKRLARRIVEIYDECYPGVHARHLSELFKEGDGDQDWIPKLAKDGDWIVITADRGKDRTKQKLPVICSKFQVTHVCLTATLMKGGYREQKQALLCVWKQLMRLPQIPKGTCLTLSYRMFNKGVTKAPALLVGKSPFDIWCSKHGIQAANSH